MTERSSPDIVDALNWLEGCLKCKTWTWDGLQREAAENALARAREAAQCSAASAEAATPLEPTEAMLDAARDWSIKKYGRGIGNDAAIGCWKAMLLACPSGVAQAKSEPGK